MEVVQLQQRGLSNTGSPARTAAPTVLQQRRLHELQSLPIARDSHGRSPLQYALSMQSPRSTVQSRPATPKASSPAAQLLESLAPGKSKNLAFPLQEKEIASHLERFLQVQSGTLKDMETLKTCSITSRDGLMQAVMRGGSNSIVACEGSPTARALSRAFPDCNPTKYAKPEAAISALEGHQAQRALLPVESSTRGSVHRTYDLLLRHRNLHIVGELVQLQLRRNSAGAAAAAPVEDEDEEAECGRFWVLSRDASLLPAASKAEKGKAELRQEPSFKTTVAMVLREGLGALHKALAAFAFRGIEVSKVESRPWRAQPLAAAASRSSTTPGAHLYFQYVLFIDIESSTASRATQSALAQLQEHASFLRLLGSYPCFHTSALRTPRPQPAPAAHVLPGPAS